MSIRVYTDDRRDISLVTPATFNSLYSRHWNDFPRYKETALYLMADRQLREMVDSKKRGLKCFISSDIEIKKIIQVLDNPFATEYNASGFLVECSAMLGMQLFELCVFDKDIWWYHIPKPILNRHLPHSHYYFGRSQSDKHREFAFGV